MTALHSTELYVKRLDEDARSIDVVASTDMVDSADEVVEQRFDLGRYKKNPVVLFAHRSRELPIGRAENVSVRALEDDPTRKALQATIVFASGAANPLAEQVFQSVRERTLRAVSIGFIPREIKVVEDGDGKTRFHLSRNELFEISVTPIPANPEAMARLRALAAPNGVDVGQGWRANPETIVTVANANIPPPSSAAQPKAKEQNEMELKEALEARETARKDADEQRARADKLEGENKTLSTEITTLAARVEAAEKRAAGFEAKEAEHDVDALVGKKITPAEREDFVALRKSNPDLFAKMISNRPSLTLLGARVTPPTTPADAGTQPSASTASGDLAARALQKAEAAVH